MFKHCNLNRSWIYIIPGIVILWSLFFLRISGPFFLTRIDPDYIYLLNGLNCANLDFSRIGHIDHPGTPFQLLTGIFIRISHLIAGQGKIVDDVISRPEFYLSVLSFYLTLISAIMLVWLGKIVLLDGNDVVGAIILQSSMFVNVFLIDLPCRYIPDRMLSVVVIMFTGFCFKYFYTGNYSGKKFAIHSGILLGIGFATKFNFLPILIVPIILITKMRERLIYFITLAIASVVSFLPVYDKFSYFKSFITSIIKHDGLYGGGSQQVFNPEVFWYNTTLIFRQNLSFTIALGVSLVAFIILLLKPTTRKDLKKEFLFFIALMFITLIGTLITAKHFKDYYIIPVISLTGFTTLILLKVGRKLFTKRYTNIVFVLLLMYFIYIPLSFLYNPYWEKQKNNYNNYLTAEFITRNVSPNDYFLIEPTWLSGPLIANGMAYGLSYVANRNYYYNEFERYYPNILTWNGKENPLQYLKMIDANNEAIFKSGRSIFIYSTPGRNADLLCNYIDSCSLNYGILYQRDMVYENSANNNHIIRLKNKSGWNEKLIGRFGFERFDGNTLFSDDEKYALSGQFNLTDICASNGYHSLILSENHSKSPELQVQKVFEGDYFEVTVKRKRDDHDGKGNLLLCSTGTDGKFYKIAEGQFVSVIHSDWELLRLCAEIHESPENGTLTCFYEYKGDAIEVIDDFTIKFFSNKPD